jgi:hypothetical protein
MDIMNATEIENFLQDFEEDQRNTIKEGIFTFPFCLYWFLMAEPAWN